MGAVTPATDVSATAPTSRTTPDAPGRRRFSPARAGYALLALLAHAAVGLAWLVTALAVMGSLGVLRRIAMNSEFAWDTGRLPQPWVIVVGIVAILVSHLFFRWAMRGAGGGHAAWGPSVIAWCGAFLGVALGAYFWIPPVVVGEQVGPASGESTPWGILGWVAHYARLELPAAVGLVTLVLLLVSRNSPLVVLWRWWRSRPRRPFGRRAERA